MKLIITTKTTGKRWTREFDSWPEAREWALRVLPSWAENNSDDVDAVAAGGYAITATTYGVATVLSE